MDVWNTLKQKSLKSLLIYFATIGAFAGLLASALVSVAQLAFGGEGPGFASLLLAILRGAIFADILALILYLIDKMKSQRDGQK